jgi:hypothetical protein
MPGVLDIALVVLFSAVWPLAEYFYLWPRHVRAVDAGDANARSRTYVRTFFEEWFFAAAVVAVMVHFGRPLSVLFLRMPHGWRLWLGLALPVAYVVLVVQQGSAIARSPKTLAKLRETLKPLRGLVPHTPREYRLFMPLCITAGLCEELLYRGYLVWVLQHWLGLWGAAGVSMVVFGLAHSYQGRQFGVRAFYAGVGMGLLALVTGSLLPGMVLHAIVDLGGGRITYMVMREEPAGAQGVGGSAA